MARGINLLPEIAQEEIKSGEYKKLRNVISFFLLSIVILSVAVIYLYQFSLSQQAKNLSEKSGQLEASIKVQATKEVAARAINTKLTRLATLLPQIKENSQTLSNLLGLTIGSSVSVSQLAISANDITVSGNVGATAAALGFFDNLLDLNQGGKDFTDVELTSYAKNENDIQFQLRFREIPRKKI